MTSHTNREPRPIRELAASLGAKMCIDPPNGPWFKFKFGECSWSPPMLEDEARAFLTEIQP